jgi:EAL domain-containing protein (putative c-di-GMP-specific phosphodiesterase class I)
MSWSALTTPVVRETFAQATVVVVDDLQQNVVLLNQLLRRAGVERVHGFTDPRLALAQIAELDPDLVLLDFHMPDLDGREFLELLHALLPADHYLPVLVITADVGREARELALSAGANDFLTKPIDTDEALLRARNLLHTRGLHTQLTRHRTELQRELAEATERERQEQEVRSLLTVELDGLLALGNPVMVFQPVVELGSHKLVGVEALARFPGPPMRSPGVVFAHADRLGRTLELEMLALRSATAQLPALDSEAFLSINVSPETALSEELHALLRTLPRERLVLELTEHTQVDDYTDLAAVLAEHRAQGMRLAIDDTGAGYASFHHLLQLQPDVIKLDIALTQGIHRDPARRALGVALVAFAEEVGATIIAEGIEEIGEVRVLQELRVPWGQGFYLGEPAPLG